MKIRDPSDPPGIPLTPDAAFLIHYSPPAPRCCPCRYCGDWALVLDSGADKPYYLCYSCYTCAPSPAPSRWRFGHPADLNAAPTAQPAQLSLL